MCGRFSLTTPGELIAEAFGLEEAPHLAPRYNIAPTQPIPVVRRLRRDEPRRLALLRWGLIPYWTKDRPRTAPPERVREEPEQAREGPRLRFDRVQAREGRGLEDDSLGAGGAPPAEGRRPSAMINARAESLSERPAFRDAFERRRCLVPADGFYEWKPVAGSKSKQPFFVRMKDGRPFAFAGLWEPPVERDGETEGTCTIVTTEPNEVLRELHDRMPVILPPEDYERWLDPGVRNPAELRPLLRPCPADWMTAYPVGRWVNDPKNDVPECVQPA